MQNLLMPFRFKVLGPACRGRTVDVLDVGCGSHSPTLTKKWLPECRYYGLDYQNYGNDAADFAVMEQFYRLDLAHDALAPLPDRFFDVIIMSHVIEHVPNGLDVVQALAGKLKPGGRIYIEFPSVRSLALPSMEGTLHFCDDPTHVRVYDVREVANVLLAAGVTIRKAGTRRDRLRIALFPLLVLVKFVLRGKLHAGDFWDVRGFASYVYGEKT